MSYTKSKTEHWRRHVQRNIEKAGKHYDTVALAVADIANISIGDVIYPKDRGGTWDAVDATTVTENEYDIVTGDATVSFKLRVGDIVYSSQVGDLQRSVTLAAGKSVDIGIDAWELSTSLVVPPNITIYGVKGLSTIKANTDLALNTPLIRNQTASVGSARSDENITFRDIVIDGNRDNRTSVTSTLVSMRKCINTTFESVELKNAEWLGIADEGCIGTSFINCTFHDNGRTSSVSPCIWAQSYVADTPDTFTKEISIKGCRFYDNDRSAILFSPKQGGNITDCYFRDNSESTIFISGLSVDSTIARDIRITDIRIENSILTDVAANGIEVENVEDIIISNFHIEGTDGAGIGLLNCKGAEVCNGVIKNTHKNATGLPAGAPKAGILVGITSNTVGETGDINIHDINFIEDQAISTQEYCIATYQAGSLPPDIFELEIRDNNMLNGYGTDVFIWNGSVDNSVRLLNNRGHSSEAPVLQQVQVPALTGNATYDIGFRPRYIDIVSVFNNSANAYLNKSTIVYERLGTNNKKDSGLSIASNSIGNAGGINAPANEIQMIDHAGNIITAGSWIGADQDGFTINWTVVSSRPWLNIVAHP